MPLTPFSHPTDAKRRLAGHRDLGNQVTGGRIPPGEVNTGLLADQAATPVAPHEVIRSERSAVGQLDIDADVVLGKARHFTPAMDRDPQLVDPRREDSFDMVLPQREPVVVASRKVADVERGHPEPRDLGDLPLREEPLRDAPLIEHLDRARMEAASARADEVLARAPLDEDDVDPRQGQLGRQHETRRTCSRDDDCVLCHAGDCAT